MNGPKDIDLSIDYCGYRLRTPFILSSGPISYSAEGLIRAHKSGFGACVTKTLRLKAAVNPVRHMGTINKDSLINCEKWSDLDCQNWYEKEIPKAVDAGVTVIASVGHTLEEVKAIVQDVERAGAHMIELVSYAADEVIPMLEYTKAHTSIPVICKLSGNWNNIVGIADQCIERGADGICAIDSIGPVLKIDIHKAAPDMGGAGGSGWLSGGAIRPISLQYIYDIAKKHTNYHNLYSSGGCMNAEDAVEFLMAGAKGVGVCTACILNGVEYIGKMRAELSDLIYKLGYNSIDEVYKAAIQNGPLLEETGALKFIFQPFKDDGTKKCISCRRCEKVCCYEARKLIIPAMHVDMDRCRSCGLCASVCPTGALSITGNKEEKNVNRSTKAEHHQLV